MGHVVQVRNIKLGEGLPKICVPLTDNRLDGLKKSARLLKESPPDFVEWRADFYDGFCDRNARMEALAFLRNELGDIPVLFTIRTKEEGGLAVIPDEEYEAVNRSVIESGLADLVDVELSKGGHMMKNLVGAAHNAGVKIVGSRHDFAKTPDEAFIVENLCRMQELGADIVKFAVMPNCERDVLTLLSAAVTMKEKHPETPVVTMSMGRLGAVSRVCGSLSGSAVTFGTMGSASAPGQLPADRLKTFLESLA